MYIRVHIKASIQILQHLRQNGEGCTDAVDERRCQECEKGCKGRKEGLAQAEDLEKVHEGDEGQA
tara:strand:- start:131 stop:325 length:195 start_codon:yes stop_codon:yes gene_type:complete